MKIRSWIGLLATTATISATPGLSAGTIIYVDDDAAPSGDGLSWQTAYRFLQDALAVSAAGDEIRVGPGEYRPDRDEANPSGTSNCCAPHGSLGCDDPGCEADVCAVLPLCCVLEWDVVCSTVAHSVCGTLCTDGRSATFQLIDGVTLQGGYAGPGAPDPDARDVGLNESILTGDLYSDDAADFVNNDENSYNVVTGSGTDDSAVLDGFTITAGNGNGDDTIQINWSAGGGMWNMAGSPKVSDCLFTANSAEFGGGMFNYGGSSPTLTGCTFDGNRGTGNGGGMYNFDDSNPLIDQCVFTGNTAGEGGGGMRNQECHPTILNSEFSSNEAFVGGGILNFATTALHPIITGCAFIGNQASSGAGMQNAIGSSPSISGCLFQGNDANPDTGSGGGMRNIIDCNPMVFDSTFESNTASAGAGIENTQNCNAFIVNCVFKDNSGVDAAGLLSSIDSDPIVTNCLFTGNAAVNTAGAVYTWGGGNPCFVNCTIADNTASLSSGGMYNTNEFGGQVDATLTNCIVYGNDLAQIAVVDAATANVCYSDVEGGWPGIGNIDRDPQFADPASCDYRLQSGSSAIDAGDNTAIAGITIDLDGNPRFADDLATTDTGNGDCPIVDMGSYEFPASCPWDLDCDGNVGITDFLALLAAWGTNPGGPPDLDGDGNVGITDFLDLLANWGPCV